VLVNKEELLFFLVKYKIQFFIGIFLFVRLVPVMVSMRVVQEANPLRLGTGPQVTPATSLQGNTLHSQTWPNHIMRRSCIVDQFLQIRPTELFYHFIFLIFLLDFCCSFAVWQKVSKAKNNFNFTILCTSDFRELHVVVIFYHVSTLLHMMLIFFAAY